MSTKTLPITPEQVETRRKQSIPAAVFKAFNDLIVKNYNGRNAIVGQNAVLAALTAQDHSRSSVFENNWLDVETHYREAGWDVSYSKPGYDDNWSAYFTFTKKKL